MSFARLLRKKLNLRNYFCRMVFPVSYLMTKIASRTESVKKHHNLFCSDFCQVLVGDVTLTIEPIKP